MQSDLLVFWWAAGAAPGHPFDPENPALEPQSHPAFDIPHNWSLKVPDMQMHEFLLLAMIAYRRSSAGRCPVCRVCRVIL